MLKKIIYFALAIFPLSSLIQYHLFSDKIETICFEDQIDTSQVEKTTTYNLHSTYDNHYDSYGKVKTSLELSFTSTVDYYQGSAWNTTSYKPPSTWKFNKNIEPQQITTFKQNFNHFAVSDLSYFSTFSKTFKGKSPEPFKPPTWTITSTMDFAAKLDESKNDFLLQANFNSGYHVDIKSQSYPTDIVHWYEGRGAINVTNIVLTCHYKDGYQITTDPSTNFINNFVIDGLKYDEISNDTFHLHLANPQDSGIYRLTINQKTIDLPQIGALDLDLTPDDLTWGIKTAQGTRFAITFYAADLQGTKTLNFLITNKINSQLESFTTDEAQTKISSYQGYLNGDASRQVNVISALNFQDGASTKITLHNQDQLLALANPQDMSGSWLELLDANYQSKPITEWLGINNKANFDLPNKTSTMQLYKLVLKDQLNNELDYYVQLGGKTNNIPDTPKTYPSTPKSYTYPLIILVATILVVIIIASFIIRFVINKSKYGASKK